MAIISDKGVEKTTLLEYKVLYEDAYKISFGDDLDLDAQTPEGQLIGIDATFASRIDDQLVNIVQQLNIFNASGNQLDGITATLKIPREKGVASQIYAEVTGVIGTIIPINSQAKTIGGDLFNLSQNVIIGASGSAIAFFESVELGAIPVEANTLTEIVTLVVGWETVNNSSPGIIGSLRQSDVAFKRFYFSVLAKNARGTQEAILASVSDVDNVIDARVEQNNTGSIVFLQNVGLLPHSIAVISQGGVPSGIAEAIFNKKCCGTNTKGFDPSLQEEVFLLSVPLPIYYYPVVFVTVTIVIEIRQYVDVPEVIDLIKDSIVSYFNGTFDESILPIGIADTLYKSRLYTPINAVRGFDVLSLSQNIGAGDQEEIVPNLNERLVTAADNIGITIVP